MAKFETKYDIGQKVFWLDVHEGKWEVKLSEIKAINFGGKRWEKYQIQFNKTRSEVDLWTDFEEAKQACLIKQQETNNRAIEIIEESKCPTRLD